MKVLHHIVLMVLSLMVAVLGFTVSSMHGRIDKLEERLTQHEQAPAVLSNKTEIVIENWRYGVQDGPDGYMYQDEPEHIIMTVGELREQISDNQSEVIRWLNNLEPVPVMIDKPEQEDFDESVPSQDPLDGIFESQGSKFVVPHVGVNIQ